MDCCHSRKLPFLHFVALLIVIVIILSGCTQPSSVKNLSGVEVSQYAGKDLSSINDFRENSIKGPQYIDISNYHLEVSGRVERPRTYAYSEVLERQRYSKVVTLNCVEGWSVTILWEGIKLSDLLDETGVKPDANTVIFHSYDGYTSSLPLEYVRNRDILLAYKMNNVTIPPERGYPFMVVAEDKWGYKWAKWVIGIELSNDSNYQGYWESRGYNGGGNLNDSRFQ